MLAPRVDNRPFFAPLLLALIALAWLALAVWDGSTYGRFLHHDELANVDAGLNWGTAGLMAVFVTGWTVMTFAMMLPTSLPLLSMFRRMTSRREDSGRLLALVVAGYVLIWAAFGLAAHAGDAALHAGVDRWHWLDDNSWTISGLTIAFAGAYQFTRLKYQCLDKCRSPLSFVTEHWTGRSQRLESFKLGIHHGIFCVGCCWSLMLLMFAVGTGNLAWMLVLGAVMAVEKNMPWGRRLSAPLGVVLIVAGVAVLAISGPDACAHTAGPCA
jgi:predicted metal-binding membrane protein